MKARDDVRGEFARHMEVLDSMTWVATASLGACRVRARGQTYIQAKDNLGAMLTMLVLDKASA